MAIEHGVMLGIPTAAIALTAAVLLGPGATRPALGARIYGATRAAPAPVAARVVTLTSLFGVEEAAATDEIAIVRDGQTLWSGASAADGVAEAAWSPKGAAEQIEIVSKRRVLARGALDLARPHPIAIEREAWIDGPTRGELQVRVASLGGPFAVGARGVLVVHVRDPSGNELDDAEVKLSAPGATVQETARTEDGGAQTFALTPEFHVVSLDVDVRATDPRSRSVDTVDATARERTGHWEGSLPVIPGAMFLGHRASGLTVVSPVPRERAYVSIWSRDGRSGGAVVKLARDADGTVESAPIAASLLGPGAVAITLSSDPIEDSVGTATWPIGTGRCASPSLELLLDGMPQAVAAERGRAWRVRRWGLLVLAAAAAAEILLLLARGRRAQAKLEAHLAEASGEADGAAMRAAESPAAYWALASAGLIAFAFAIVAGLAAFR